MAAKRIYSWDDWFSLDAFVVRRGDDFSCSMSAMSQQIRDAASVRGLSVHLDDIEDEIMVKVRRPAHTCRR